MTTEENEIAEKKVGIVEISKKQFEYYPEEMITFDGEEIKLFHFKKPSVEVAERHQVVLSNEMSVGMLRKIVRASLLRVINTDDREIVSTKYNNILKSLDVDELTEMSVPATAFFAKAVG